MHTYPHLGDGILRITSILIYTAFKPDNLKSASKSINFLGKRVFEILANLVTRLMNFKTMLVDNKNNNNNNLRKKQPVPMILSAHSIQGRRTHMEDFFDTGYKLKACDQLKPNEWPYEYFYFAIFDGHGGDDAARYARQNLMNHIIRQKSFWSAHDEDVMQAIRDGFASCQKAMRETMHEWKRTGKVPLPSTAGTTASIIIIRNGKYYSGHVGDSRIVIAREDCDTHQWIADQITEDHKPESDEEMVRIKRAGGEVRDKIGVSRVVWRRPVLKEYDPAPPGVKPFKIITDYVKQLPRYPVEESLVASYQTIPFLAIARSLGDFWSINPHSGQYIVSPEPDVTCRPISRQDRCILLATDGLWNVVNSCQASRFLQELYTIKREKKANHKKEYYSIDNFYDVAGSENENYAVSLVYFAYQMWERKRIKSDNITAVVAMLGDLLEPYYFNEVKPYNTRRSLSCDEHKSFNFKDLVDCIQLKETSTYFEQIPVDSRPKFSVDKASVSRLNDIFQRLEDFLLFPPTIVHKKFGHEYPQLGMPRNYIRLALADYRKIRQPDTEDTDTEAYIHIKTASDDPADRMPKYNTRKSKTTGKMVRDASCQATQTIHDFGQPWKTMRQFSAEEDDIESGADDNAFDWFLEEDEVFEDANDEFENDDMEIELVRSWMLKPGDVVVHRDRQGNRYSYTIPDPDQDYNVDDNTENEDDSDHNDSDDDDDDKSSGGSSDENDGIEGDGSRNNSKAKKNKTNREVSQLRCLMNHTPYKRTTRSGTYLSVTEKPRRKLEDATTPKPKRRKSHPVNCGLAEC